MNRSGQIWSCLSIPKCLCRCISLSSTSFHHHTQVHYSRVYLHCWIFSAKTLQAVTHNLPLPFLFYLTIRWCQGDGRGRLLPQQCSWAPARGCVCCQYWGANLHSPALGRVWAPWGQLLASKLTSKAFWCGHCFTEGTAAKWNKARGILCGTAVLIMLAIEEVLIIAFLCTKWIFASSQQWVAPPRRIILTRRNT